MGEIFKEMIELPAGERMRVKDVRETDGAAELIASRRQTCVGDNHISPVSCITGCFVIVDYKCRVMSLLSR